MRTTDLISQSLLSHRCLNARLLRSPKDCLIEYPLCPSGAGLSRCQFSTFPAMSFEETAWTWTFCCSGVCMPFYVLSVVSSSISAGGGDNGSGWVNHVW